MEDEDMNELIPNEDGIWIECCVPTCKKWRYVREIDDPLMVPEKWYCYMNPDRSANTCSAPERTRLEEDEVFVESKYKAGSIVWAKVIGYPWYPAMVDFCPDFKCYYWFDKPRSNIPTQYHVKFFGQINQSRAWIGSKFVKPFLGNDEAFALKSKRYGKKLTSKQREKILQNCKIARSASTLPILQRLKKYSYQSWLLSQRLRNQFKNVELQSAPSVIPTPSSQSRSNNFIEGSRRKTANNESHTKIIARNVDGEKIKPSTSKAVEADKLPQNVSEMTSSLTDTTVTDSTATTSKESYEDTDSYDSSIQKNILSNRNKNCARSVFLKSNRVSGVANKRHVIDVIEEKSEIRNEDGHESVKIMKKKKNKGAAAGGGKEEKNKENGDRIASEEMSWESVPSSPQPGPSRLSLELKLMRERRRRNGQLIKEQKSASEGSVRKANESENNSAKEPSRRREDSEQCSSMNNKPAMGEKINIETSKAKPNTNETRFRELSEWFENADLRDKEKAECNREDSERESAEKFAKFQRQMRESVLSELSAGSTISSREGNMGPARRQPITFRKYNYSLLTSDDDSFA